MNTLPRLALVSAFLLLLSSFAEAATFTVTGTTLQLNLTAANESVAITAGATNYTFALTGGTWSGTDSADATGNGTASLSAVKASFTAVTIDDGSTGNAVTFNTSGANTYTSNFIITLDDATAGAITFNGNTPFTGSAALSASTSKNIALSSAATLTSVSGDLTLSANQQAVGTDFADNGINVGQNVQLTTTSGNITLRGRGGLVNGYTGVSIVSLSGTSVVGGAACTGKVTIIGQGGGQASNGLYMLRTSITTGGGDIEITGTGGTSTGFCHGVYVDTNSFVKAGGAGNVSITGNGGTGTNANGIRIWGRPDAVSSGTGSITLTGNATSATGSASTGIAFQNGGGASSSGNIILTGIGATGAVGLELDGGSAIATTGSGNVSLIADSMSIGGTVNAQTRAVSLSNYSIGLSIDLGSTTDGAAGTLGLSNAELNNITASTLNIGDANTAVINVSAAITLPAGATANLTAAAINLNGNTISGATVNQTTNGQQFITVEQPAGTLITDTGTAAFGQVVQGGTGDLVFTLKNPGSGDLTGLGITIDGTNASEFSVFASPTAPVAPGGSTTFTIRHAPVTAGTKTAALHIASNAVGTLNPYDIKLTASSLPDISVEQPAGTALADGGTSGFGTVVLGGTADLVFTVKNPGTSDLAISGITFDGTNASEFSVFAASASSVSASGSTTFTVRCAPTSLGSKTAALHIASNVQGAKNPYDINLTAVAVSAPLSGTKSVGPTGYYTSLTQAITDIQAAGLGGALVLELQSTYVSTVETFPLTIPALNGASATKTLTIRPASGATGLSITSVNGVATVDLNGANYVTFDGRPGGAGTAKHLTIENTDITGSALRFINEGSNNTIKFVTIQGRNLSNTSGTVLFTTTTGANGNDNNTIDTCDIRESGGVVPANGIYSSGSTGTTAQNNSGNTITNCNIFNFYSSSFTSCGVLLSTGNTDWTISGNSFYQTAPPLATPFTMNPIFINNASGNNFTVTGNYIGGSAANAGGTPWTPTGNPVAYLFQGIRLNVGTTTASSVQGNTIANIVWTSSSTATTLPGVWSGIFVVAGNVNIGTVTGNTIGSGTGTGSISVTTSGTGGTSFGIGSTSSGTVAIANNTIGSITVNNSLGNSASLVGIQVTAGTNTISNNTVGSTTTANSLNAATSSTSGTSAQGVTGILSSSTTSASITGNTVANLNNNSVQPGLTLGQIRGIATSVGVNTITGNTVRNLSTTSANQNSTTTQSVFGIIDTSTTAGQTVSQNTVHSLANTAATGNVNVTGIYFAGPTSGANVIARNLVHSLAVSSTSASSALNGMQFVAGAITAQNNMVRVGLKADGTSTAGASTVRGMYDNGTTAGRNFYHNSVYVGGTQTSLAANTSAFQSSGTGNARTYQNNIFVNARSKGGTATGKHYAVFYGTSVSLTGLTAGGNLFLANGTNGVLGNFSTTATSTDISTLAAWRSATGQDGTSLNADPLFIAPTGTAATVDLHIPANSPANNAGLVIAAVTDDFDGSPRSHSAPDIGADEILSNNANLASLSLDSGPISPVFSATTTAYTATVPNGTTTVSATVATADNQASVLITGGSNLAVGANTLTITVTSPDTSVTKTYTVTITRNSAFQDWAAANSTVADNTTLANFAFGTAPGVSSALVYTGTFAGGGAITATGTPITALEPTTDNVDFRALFVRRKDYVAAGLTYTPQFSANLTTWFDSADVPTVLSDDGTNQIVSVPYPPFVGGKKARFFHVTVSIAP